MANDKYQFAGTVDAATLAQMPAHLLRRGPDGGIFVDAADLRPSAPRIGSAGELIAAATQVWAAAGPLLRIAMAAMAATLVIPAIGGIAIIALGIGRQRSPTVPNASSFAPAVAAAMWFSIDPFGFMAAAARRLADGFGLVFGYTDISVFPGAEGSRLVADAPTEKLNFAAGFKLFFENSFVRGEFTKFMHSHAKQALMNPEYSEKALAAIPKIIRASISNVANNVGQKADLFELSSDIALRVLLRFALGETLFNQNDDDLVPVFQLAEKKMFAGISLYLRSLAPGATAAKAVFKNLVAIVQEELDRINKSKDAGVVDLSSSSLIASLVSANSRIKAEVIVSHITFFVVSNHSDLAATTSWTLMHILADKDLKSRVETELKQAGLYNTAPDVSLTAAFARDPTAVMAKTPLKTLSAVIREVGRRYSPLFLIRGSLEKQTLGTYTVYRNDLVAISPALVSLDDSVYASPREFDPSRLMDPTHVASLKSAGKFTQFSNADEAWLGASMAESIIKLVMVPMLLTGCDMELTTSSVVTNRGNGSVAPSYLAAFGTPFADRPVWVTVKE